MFLQWKLLSACRYEGPTKLMVLVMYHYISICNSIFQCRNSSSTRNHAGRRRTTLWMCYLQIIIYLFIYLFIIYIFYITVIQYCFQYYLRKKSKWLRRKTILRQNWNLWWYGCLYFITANFYCIHLRWTLNSISETCLIWLSN